MRLTKLYTRFVILVSDIIKSDRVRMIVADSRSIFRTLSNTCRAASVLEIGGNWGKNFIRKIREKGRENGYFRLKVREIKLKSGKFIMSIKACYCFYISSIPTYVNLEVCLSFEFPIIVFHDMIIFYICGISSAYHKFQLFLFFFKQK